MTPGSVHLILQTLLPLLYFSPKTNGSFNLGIKGGTMVSFSPSFISQKFVLLPLLKKFGFEVEYSLLNPGLSMKIMGHAQLTFGDYGKCLKPVEMVNKGDIKKVRIYISLR